MSQKLNKLIIGKNRGKNLIPIFKKYNSDISNSNILDVGCGYGSLTVDFAKEFKYVHSIDGGDKEIAYSKERVMKENLKNIQIQKDNALKINSTSKKFDIVHLTGVFEWLRVGNKKISASKAQDLFLKNIKSFLKDENSIMYLSTENRFFPYYSIKDPHSGLPIVVLFNEKFSDFLFKIFGKLYLPKIYSYWRLKKKISKEFKFVKFYVPIPHYQYVFEFADINNRNEIVYKCKKILKNQKLSFMDAFTVYWILWSARLYLIKLFTPGFIVIAKK